MAAMYYLNTDPYEIREPLRHPLLQAAVDEPGSDAELEAGLEAAFLDRRRLFRQPLAAA